MNDSQNTQKSALVLGGGGARGCYEIGAWQAFRDCGIHFDCVAGTSIGALVGAIYVQHTLKPLVDFVYSMSPEMIVRDMPVMPESWNDLHHNREELMKFFRQYIRNGSDISPLRDAIHKMFDWKLFSESDVDFACMTINVSKMQGEAFFKKDMTEENAEDIILASASCFPAFPMLKMGNDYYIDGGMEDNLPIGLAEQMGARSFTVIDVHGPGRTRALPSDGTVTYLQPIIDLNNFLDFQETSCVRSLHLGYLETMKQYDRFCGYVFTFTQDSWPRLYMISQYVTMHLQKYGIVPTNEMAGNIFRMKFGYTPAPLVNRYNENYAGGRLIEALAIVAGVEPVALMSLSYFMTLLNQKLNSIPPLTEPRSVRDSLALLQSSSREQITAFLHGALIHNSGRMPVVLDPLRKLFENEYILACTWYCLHDYLK